MVTIKIDGRDRLHVKRVVKSVALRLSDQAEKVRVVDQFGNTPFAGWDYEEDFATVLILIEGE